MADVRKMKSLDGIAIKVEYESVLLDQASDFVGYWIEGDEHRRRDCGKAMLHASNRAARECGYRTFMHALEHPQSLARIGSAAEKMCDLVRSDDATLALYSDAYAAVAVICNNHVGRYAADAEALKICEMAARLYSAVYMVETDASKIN
jgi:hypothetical protein